MIKKFRLMAVCLFMGSTLHGQVTVDHVYTTDAPFTGVNLSLSGLKYVAYHTQAPTSYSYFNLYNPDHTIFKTITLPIIPGKITQKIMHISETLFDTDTLIEYLADYVNTTTLLSSLYVFNENGAMLMQCDSCNTGGNGGLAEVYNAFQVIFPDGANTKLMVQKHAYINGSWEQHAIIYNLPGQLACLECDGGVISGIAQNYTNDVNKESALAYPNPFNNYVKVKYELPPIYKEAHIKLFDIAGKLIRIQQIENQSGDIYISSDEITGGAYFYHIEVDGKNVASGKLIKAN